MNIVSMQKIDRIASWVLFATFLLYFISGYAMTKGIIGYQWGSSLHLNYLAPIAFASFAYHTFFALYLCLKRWRIWNNLFKFLLVFAYMLLSIGFVYINYFYKQPVLEGETAERVFTKKDLSAYDGKNGQSAYIAVDGLVYDLSSLYENGIHFGCEAGEDISEEFYRKHPSQFLNMFDVIGIYSE